MTVSTNLTARQVASLVADALALRGPLEVRPIDEGGEHLAWSVGERHVARFAADAGSTRRQRRELAVRDLLRHRVGVALPRSAAAGEWAPGLAFTVDERLPGTSAEARPVSAAGERDLAVMLSGLRAVPIATAAGLGVPTAAERDVPELVREAAAAAGRLAAQDRLRAECAPERLAVPVGPPRAQVLLHADLKGEHLLVDESGAISGVLDWTDAETGDPATDVAGLVISVGAPAAARIAERAGYGEDLVARGLVIARCDTVIRLDDLLNGDDDSPEALLRDQLARAWQPTPLDERSGSR
ncbi:phosphotransferase family protein [Saccharopolyspora elongata]|uniref:Aminoglycoside phosphotransferase family protein n=1 Tax=Saccharopolyspora elongata TaxID=2530387 RepID=A0A4V2YN02_9PSEU|nr:aminoglycoside phosphotransferase family protein [Saccharopolyspora elongata]TDD52467.1 aminoglycoside phosphotransferase family protein [Saccharopolyspora elongata]